jgi:predicted nucleic acid-binding protein
MIHLDTSFLIRALVADSPESTRLHTWIAGGLPVGIGAVCWTEFLCGPLTEAHVDLALALLSEPVAYTAADAHRAAALFNTSGRRRGSLVDCMVAAAAIEADAALATSNPKDFQRFAPQGLRLA